MGKATLGRVFNLIGEPIDDRGPVNADAYWSIHRDAPPVTDLSTKTELFETGIKVIDLLTPFVRGGKAGLFGGAGLGKTVILTELIARIASSTAVTRYSPAWANAPAKGPTCGWKCRKPRSAIRAARHRADVHGVRPDERAAGRAVARGAIGIDDGRILPR